MNQYQTGENNGVYHLLNPEVVEEFYSVIGYEIDRFEGVEELDASTVLEIKNEVREALQSFQNQESYHIGIISKTNESEALTTYSVSQDWYNGNDWGRYIYFGEPKEFGEYWLDMGGQQLHRVLYYTLEGGTQSDTGWYRTEFGKNETGECWLRKFLWNDNTMELTDLACAGDATDYTFTVTEEIYSGEKNASSYQVCFRQNENGDLIYACRVVQWPNEERSASEVYIYSYDEKEITEKLEEWYTEAVK